MKPKGNRKHAGGVDYVKRVNYMKRASQRFLAGTKFRSPVEAVEAGARSLAEWAELLAEEREAEAEQGRSEREVTRRSRLERPAAN